MKSLDFALLESWIKSVKEPETAQRSVFARLISIYSQTRYGRMHGAYDIDSLEEFREKFPTASYQSLKPYIDMVKAGEYEALLTEPPEFWGLTSGTRGPPKLIPITKTDLEVRARVMLKGLMQYVSHWNDNEVLRKPCLAIYLPSRVDEIECGDRIVPCGYISGIYAECFEKTLGFHVKPSIKTINELGAGVSKADWERRFEITYDALKDDDVALVIGSVPPLQLFGRWLKRKYGKYPKDVWDIHLILCSGVAGIWDVYVDSLKKMYGHETRIIEAYGATEGTYAQQMDENPLLVPFYDTYLFEVETRKGCKMLYEMKAGEWGRLIVSSTVLPRYEIGDIIECYEDGLYFKVHGRATISGLIEYILKRLVFTIAKIF